MFSGVKVSGSRSVKGLTSRGCEFLKNLERASGLNSTPERFNDVKCFGSVMPISGKKGSNIHFDRALFTTSKRLRLDNCDNCEKRGKSTTARFGYDEHM